MIDELHVENIALIVEADIEPSEKLTVVTGETGAGKSALLSAIKLISGERADASIVREGATSSIAEARLFIHGDEEEKVVHREIMATGRSRCKLDGSMTKLSELKSGPGASVDLMAQNEHQRLTNPHTHLEILDGWIGTDFINALTAYQNAFEAGMQAQQKYDEIMQTVNRDAAEVETARFVLSQINDVNPQKGELEELELRLSVLSNSETLSAGAGGAYEAISSEEGALDSLNSAVYELTQVEEYDERLEKYVSSLKEAVFIVEDIVGELRRYRDEIEFDPAVLEEVENRIGDYTMLLRAYGPHIEQVIESCDKAALTVDAFDNQDKVKAEAKLKLEQAEHTLATAANVLHEARMTAAINFAREVGKTLEKLEMDPHALVVDVSMKERAQWNRKGPDKVEFMYRASEELTLRPLVKIASGGEVSRLMLAIKVAMGKTDTAETLVFDEVDAGLGGTTARSIAGVLEELAQTHQVIVVTHLAQVAVAASRHYIVKKSMNGGKGSSPQSEIAMVSGEERVKEIARMLSGDVNEASLNHARGLLEEKIIL